ncbi:MAG TPA: protein-glutamine glutaminase family protein [Rhizomicrobium sp.]|nr:protein-glutamine glutaminase family protein [Rhizomicrobium sp.]
MATPEVIVSRHVRLDVPADQDPAEAARSQDLEVALDEGRRVRLQAANERSTSYAQILSGLERLRLPVYLEVDPDSHIIKMLRIPEVGRAGEMREIEQGFEFQLDSSQMRFLLRKGGERFGPLSEILREAVRSLRPLILTNDERGEVIDIRFFEPGPGDGPFPNFPWPRPRPVPDWEWLIRWLRWPIWPWRWWVRGCISSSHAQQSFNAMSATTCAPLTVPAPCIPFLYPDDGCWARAHEMCRLMIASGLSPRKVWIQGSLHTPTRNNPSCFVNWGWHVAPTLCVVRPLLLRWPWSWLWIANTMVIDPSLFTGPVTVAQWKSVQGDPGATLTYTDASDYLWGQTDPTYSKTADRLAYYRLQLQARAINSGPPPYAYCP